MCRDIKLGLNYVIKGMKMRKRFHVISCRANKKTKTEISCSLGTITETENSADGKIAGTNDSAHWGKCELVYLSIDVYNTM